MRDVTADAAPLPDEPDERADAYAPADPDAKDWTWVLRERCPECGFAGTDVAGPDLAGTIHDLVPRWRAALNRLDVRDRPAPGTWSPLEYGAHVRDVHRVFDERLRLILEEDDPLFPNWDQDATAAADRYDLQDPGRVADELADAAAVLAARFQSVRPDQWDRPGRRSNGSSFTATTLGQYFLHDVVHHLHDVRA
ncbi:methyltransferase type 12 [Cellulomonas hominis]|uniref:Methyltransferase type 12 n=1 Tax=Cellulomonas hominis TaxID=156981 RepID=A0A511FEQ9_9CELL|nr:methyltransferase type 12 [Cellulomonas hominis]